MHLIKKEKKEKKTKRKKNKKKKKKKKKKQKKQNDVHFVFIKKMIFNFVFINLFKINMYSQSVKQLKSIAKEYKIKGYSTMKKDELLNSIKQYIEKESKNELKCNGLCYENDTLKKCSIITNEKYCLLHRDRYKLEIPDECTICFENIDVNKVIPLSCGHWFHKECLIPTNVHSCPICRGCMDKLDINYIFGKFHKSVNNYSNNDIVEYNEFLNENINHSLNENDLNECNCEECIRRRSGIIILNEYEEEELINILSGIIQFRIRNIINSNSLLNMCNCIIENDENKLALYQLSRIDIQSKLRRARTLERSIFNFINFENYNNMRLILSVIDSVKNNFI